MIVLVSKEKKICTNLKKMLKSEQICEHIQVHKLHTKNSRVYQIWLPHYNFLILCFLRLLLKSLGSDASFTTECSGTSLLFPFVVPSLFCVNGRLLADRIVFSF